MRIAIFSDNFYPELSGISDSIIALSKELALRGHFIDFYVPGYSVEDFKVVGLMKKEIDLGKNIQVIRFFSFPYKQGTNQGRFVVPTGLRAFTLFKFHADVIHSQMFFGVGLEAIFAARILKKPVVGTNHTALKEFLKYSPIKSKWFNGRLLAYMNWYYERCELVTAPSQSVFDEMIELGFKNVKMRVISNPIDTKMFAPLGKKEELRKKFGFTGPTIIHAGRISDERHPDVLVRALTIIRKTLPNAMLVFAGKGNAEIRLRDLVVKEGLKDNVKFLGFIDKPMLAEVYNASDVFAIASTSDTQSLVLMQAEACGVPVVGVRARALPEYINDKNGFIVEPNDPAAMAEKLTAILTNPELAKKLGDGGHEYAAQFSEPKIAEEWEKIYGSVIKSYNERNHIK